MPSLRVNPSPHADELWLSRPPFRMIARILKVEQNEGRGGAVSYVLYDEEGSSLEHVSGAPLDDTWWHHFQPLTARQG